VIALPLVGAAFGAAVFWLIVQVRPPTPDPLVQLGRFYAARTHTPHSTARTSGGAGMQTRIGRTVAAELHRRGLTYTTLRQDLALNGEDFDTAMGRKVLSAVGGFLFGLLLMVLLETVGVSAPVGTPLVVAIGMAGLFFLVPDLDARQAAAKRRREFRRALGAYLDWVSLQMSGRAAAEQALPDAARIGGGWPLALIRHTVLGATRSGQDVWTALAELGERIGVTPLRELGALVQLVAHDGAQVRDTLTARAASLRVEELAEAQGTAGKRDQSMLAAQILLGVGFAVFIGYPAVINVLHL
jgi:tight adherence protein C